MEDHFRLSVTLRGLSFAGRFNNIGINDEDTANGGLKIDEKLLEEKIKRQRQLLEEESVTNGDAGILKSWSELKSEIMKNCNKQDCSKVEELFHKLLQSSKDLTGIEEDLDQLQEACVFLYQLFSESSEMSRSTGEAIKAQFGPYPAKMADKVCEIVKSIASFEEKTEPSIASEESILMKEEFRHNLKFAYPDNFIKDAPISVNEEVWSDQEDQTSDNDDLITKGLMQGLRKTAGVSRKTDHAPKTSTDKTSTVNKYGGVWLERACQSCNIPGLSWQQLYSKIFDLLLSDTAIDMIQSELVELLGFDQLDFIQDLLINRSLIVDCILNEQSLAAPTNTGRPQPRSMPNINKEQRGKGPAVTSMITVQTSEEKELKKQLRKEEKRDEKLRQKREKEMADEGGGYSEMEDLKLGYDPHVLRMEREADLEDASRRPLFSVPAAPFSSKVSYPNVFDSLAEVKRSTSFIAGQKIVLPESAVKRDKPMYEEISITAFGKEGPPKITERVVIKELDDIIKMAFTGTKSLNIIQSQVFPTAYCSNENMLISAPTGAGKTNIAMLTVLNEIKNNIGNDGVIKKDQFKIIYVAPMKALAGEMVANFGKRLSPLGVSVKELTGDMQLTKQEIQNTNMIVTTPEKWDVVTRKSTGDVALAQIVKLLIIDEVHLLHEDRGAVIECLVARTLRQVESSQRLIRIIGLSATLPNYLDVARFLRVNPVTGLYVFDERFRPVPLSQTFVGIKARSKLQQTKDMDTVCYEKCCDYARKDYQVMVFVHSRNGTVKTATTLKEMASSGGDSEIFRAKESPELGSALKQVEKSRYKPLKELFPEGFAVHHAGMLRHDRNLVERLFTNGLIKVLVCTATLAWGVNLPAHAVIIKGTQLYDAKKGSFVDLGILDVCQIFGRAGRPQFDTHGEGTIITSHDKLSHYLSLMTRQNDIESQLTESLADALNAEIALGTISTINEAVQWLKYTYLYVRLQKNPLAYGIDYYKKQRDPFCEGHCHDLVTKASIALDRAHMVRYMERNGTLSATDVGRTASHYYIRHASIEIFNEMLLKQHLMTEADILAMAAKSQEFEQIKVREDEVVELEEHLHGTCMLPVKKGGTDNPEGKVNILLQTYIGRGVVNSFSLVSDLAYVAQNSGRITRGLFEICLRKGWASMAYKLLELSKCIDHQMWHMENPLKQFNRLSFEIVTRLQEKNATIDKLRDMTDNDIGHLIGHVRMGKEVKKCVDAFPTLSLVASIQPITRTVLRVNLQISPDFTWDDRIHGNGCESWWVWVEDPNNDHMYHSEYFLLHKKQVVNCEPQELVFTIPIFDPLPPQYYVKATSDRWLGSQSLVAISFKHLVLPELHPPHTKLLDLHPLPIKALANKSYESIFKFKFFNPIQTQTFHTLYHSDTNVLLGAPTGSGKTVAAEIAMFRVFNHSPGGKCVYIAPLKALVRERILDWKIRLQETLHKKVIELTGDTAPDIKSIQEADVIVTTPEKWDGISRSWQNRSYVQDVRLIVIDEIHLLGDERGPVLEVIVSRTNFIGAHTNHQVRVVGLSTALANASDLASWLGISSDGLFNFHPAVRPVQLDVHLHGYPGKHYCPRMATMNKPCFTAIATYSPSKPVLIFVSSRRQTRLTAFDLVSFMATADNPKQWLRISEEHLDSILQDITDTNLRFALSFGIGIHHAGLKERDRKCVEELFVNQKIQILIATATLAWGVNFPAHLVIVKGTEYFDGKTQRYVDYPITDVLQMMGRAGRPQYDDKGVAMILVHDVKKDFYKKFLYEPFPVESNLLAVLADHLNAEIVAGTISTKQEALDYITWTYFFQRLIKNPSYYQLEDSSPNQVNRYLTKIVNDALIALQDSYCISFNEDNRNINSEVLGCISSFYYLHHKSVKMFKDTLRPSSTMEEIISILSEACEYNELPVRHNEDKLNATLSANVPLRIDPSTVDSPHTKAFLLLQAHFSRVDLPIVDYITDTKSVLDQALRILQACLDISANEGWLQTTLVIMNVVQMCCQGRWSHDSSLLCLPHITDGHIDTLNKALAKQRSRFGINEITCIPELLIMCKRNCQFLQMSLGYSMAKQQLSEIQKVLDHFSLIQVQCIIIPSDGGTKSVNRTAVSPDTDGVLTLACASEYILEVKCRSQSRGHKDTKAYTPRFPKSKDEGWWLVLGIVDTQELVAMKRVGHIGHTHRLIFEAPPTACHANYSLYLISDCYLGLDQQVDIRIATIHNE